MRTCSGNIPQLFYTRYPDDGHDLALPPAHRTQAIAIEASGQALQPYRPGGRDAGEHSVLIAGDDLAILEAYTQLVQSVWPACRVVHATNERLALDMLRGERPSLVLLDRMMPGIDGFGLLDAVRSDARLRAVPVVVLVAHGPTQPEIARFSDAIAALLIKELFTLEETRAQIKRALAGRKRLRSATRRMVREVMVYIHEHYAEPLTRDALAAAAAVSPRHLTRCFAAEVGIPPIAYLNRYRIREAKRLLRSGERSIGEIARAVGFSNIAYFDVVFRREVGLVPSDYRWCHQAGDQRSS
jgi:YesN/AraC family two-component response regulator